LVEQRIENPRVGGSIPPQATTYSKPTPLGWLFHFRKAPMHARFRVVLRVRVLFADRAKTALFDSFSLSVLCKPLPTPSPWHTHKAF
jgi:hypothetical protein